MPGRVYLWPTPEGIEALARGDCAGAGIDPDMFDTTDDENWRCLKGGALSEELRCHNRVASYGDLLCAQHDPDGEHAAGRPLKERRAADVLHMLFRAAR